MNSLPVNPGNNLFRNLSEHGIRWVPVRIRAMGIPLPLTWFQFDVRERAEHGRYLFDVRVALLGLGLLVHYQGWLEIDD